LPKTNRKKRLTAKEYEEIRKREYDHNMEKYRDDSRFLNRSFWDF
jgi:hypothetical protein